MMEIKEVVTSSVAETDSVRQDIRTKLGNTVTVITKLRNDNVSAFKDSDYYVNGVWQRFERRRIFS